MASRNYMLLYVEDPKMSAAFYAGLLDRQPVELSPTFALFALESGMMLGLWSRHTVEPAAACTGGGCELGWPVDSDAAVDATHADWSGRGVRIIQKPTQLDFGRSFVAEDPDAHRLRVFALATR